MVVGGVFTGIAFLVSGFVELKLEVRTSLALLTVLSSIS